MAHAEYIPIMSVVESLMKAKILINESLELKNSKVQGLGKIFSTEKFILVNFRKSRINRESN